MLKGHDYSASLGKGSSEKSCLSTGHDNKESELCIDFTEIRKRSNQKREGCRIKEESASELCIDFTTKRNLLLNKKAAAEIPDNYSPDYDQQFEGIKLIDETVPTKQVKSYLEPTSSVENRPSTDMVSPNVQNGIMVTAKPTPYEVAQQFITVVKFRIVGGALYFFNGIVFELLDDDSLDRLIVKCFRQVIEMHGKPDIIKAVRTFIKAEPKLVIDDPTIDPNYIVFRNGRLDIRTMEFSDNDPLVFQTSYLNFNYDRYNTHCPNFEKYLESVSGGDPDIKELMLQTHGYIASCSMDAKSFFLFIGEGDTGKSLTIGLDTMFFPNDFVSTIELQALGDKFSTGNLANVRLNVGGDLPNKPLTPDVVKHVKGITGNDMMTAEKKFVQPFSFKPTCKLVFATNHPLVLQQRDDQFCERLVVIPFDNKIPKDRQDHDLLNKLRDELPAIFNMILEAFLRLRNNNFEFKKVVNLSNYVAIPLSESGSVSHLEEAVDDFVSIHYEITGDSGDFVSIKQLYAEFNAYYLQHYNLNTNQDKFSKAFRQLFDKSETNGYPRKYQSNAHGRGYQGIRRKD
jgi:P4 family phage/plasmid primase-like protien